MLTILFFSAFSIFRDRRRRRYLTRFLIELMREEEIVAVNKQLLADFEMHREMLQMYIDTTEAINKKKDFTHNNSNSHRNRDSFTL